jgi:hypothetical protein
MRRVRTRSRQHQGARAPSRICFLRTDLWAQIVLQHTLKGCYALSQTLQWRAMHFIVSGRRLVHETSTGAPGGKGGTPPCRSPCGISGRERECATWTGLRFSAHPHLLFTSFFWYSIFGASSDCSLVCPFSNFDPACGAPYGRLTSSTRMVTSCSLSSYVNSDFSSSASDLFRTSEWCVIDC